MFRPLLVSLVAFLLIVILTTGQVSASMKYSDNENDDHRIVNVVNWHTGSHILTKYEYWVDLQAYFEQFFNFKIKAPERVEQEEETSVQEQNEESKREEWQKDEPKQDERLTEETKEENISEQQKDEELQKEELHTFEQQVLNLVNIEREKHGLQPVQMSVELSEVARMKSQDMASNGYFSHQSPTYGSPFDMMDQFGLHYRAAGENIAMGQRSPEEVMNGWMNSDGHRANILNGHFTHLGVGYVESNGTTYWTQMFIGK